MRGVAIAAGLCLALAAVYVTQAPLGNARSGKTEAEAAETIAAIKPLARGEVAAFVAADAPKPVPEIRFVNRAGEPVGLADWKGKTVLVNLWATWCSPCKREMPALDALHQELGGEAFEVVAINIDRGGPEKGERFYEEVGLEALGYYHDAEGKIFRELGAFGMPVTLLVDRNGLEIGRLNGPAEWHSPDAIAMIKAALAAGKRS